VAAAAAAADGRYVQRKMQNYRALDPMSQPKICAKKNSRKNKMPVES
jgi:hypothetical protein